MDVASIHSTACVALTREYINSPSSYNHTLYRSHQLTIISILQQKINFKFIMRVTTQLALAAAVAGVSASPVKHHQNKQTHMSLKQVNNVKSAKGLVESGKSRIAKINNRTTNGPSSGSVTNEDVSYVAPVSIGGSTFSLIVDTGCKQTKAPPQIHC